MLKFIKEKQKINNNHSSCICNNNWYGTINKR